MNPGSCESSGHHCKEPGSREYVLNIKTIDNYYLVDLMSSSSWYCNCSWYGFKTAFCCMGETTKTKSF